MQNDMSGNPSLFRCLLRRLMMLDPGYRKASFLEQKLDQRCDELRAAIEAARPVDRTDELRAAIEAARPVDRTDELRAAIEAARPVDRTDELRAAIEAARPVDRTDELRAAIEAAKGEIWNLRVLLDTYWDYVNPEIMLMDHGSRPTQEFRRVLLVGYYGGNNLGDELMLRTLLDVFKTVKNVKVTVMLAENPEYDIATLGDVDIVHYCRCTSDLAHLAARFDVLFIGGGALLDDVAYPWMNYHFKTLSFIVAELPRYFKARNKRVVCYGLSTNDRIEDGKYKRLLAELVSRSDYFSVRDKYSLETLLNCGIERESIECVDDIVLSNCNVSAAASLNHSAGDVCIIGIVWVAFEEYRRLLEEVIALLLAERTAVQRCVRIKLIPFCDDVNHADIVYYNSVVQGLSLDQRERITISEYSNDMMDILAEIDACCGMVNMRYHAAMLGACRGVPQVAVRLAGHRHYGNKMRSLCDLFEDRIRMLDTNCTAADIEQGLVEQIARGWYRVIDRDRIVNNACHLRDVAKLSFTEKEKYQ